MQSALRCLGLAAILFLLVFLPVQPAGAQVLPAGVVVDSALRIDFLFGNQIFGRMLPSRAPGDGSTDNENLRLDLKTRMPVVDGMLELSLSPFLSLRGSGMSGFLAGDFPATLVSYRDPESNIGAPRRLLLVETSAKPDYQSWETAGLIHLYADGGYRFSIVAGYRQDYWRYSSTDGGANNNTLEYKHASRIPFLGLQTAISFPWWKARMEVLGSPFMTKFIYLHAAKIPNYMTINGRWNNGGLIEVRAEGLTFVSSTMTIGISARYSYEEQWGNVDGIWEYDNKNPHWPYDFFTTQNLAYVGLNVGLIF